MVVASRDDIPDRRKSDAHVAVLAERLDNLGASVGDLSDEVGRATSAINKLCLEGTKVIENHDQRVSALERDVKEVKPKVEHLQKKQYMRDGAIALFTALAGWLGFETLTGGG